MPVTERPHPSEANCYHQKNRPLRPPAAQKRHIFSSVVLPSAEGYSRLWANLVSSYPAVISTNRIHYSTMTLGNSLSSDPASTPASPGQGSLSSLPNTPLPSDISHPSVSIQSVKESSWGDVAVLDKTSNNYAAWS
ncbi:hypothetical protein K443DRAFT_14910 [Laccaria amethystina LaAM-08-1]|uniref:Uncharacterized protein n=1 Tax=Laccaria amethystina LaAM-08-1 TaxID=1095629 RepID=A0A0C9WZT3_9AGAR|nr:hypothetical protein K443DRAFT_14910 [Laccaria amethystina LaAM-08-1]